MLKTKPANRRHSGFWARGAILSAPNGSRTAMENPRFTHNTASFCGTTLQPSRLAAAPFHVEVKKQRRRHIIALLTINRHDALFWLQPKRAEKKGERPTAGRGTEGGGIWLWYSPHKQTLQKDQIDVLCLKDFSKQLTVFLLN